MRIVLRLLQTAMWLLLPLYLVGLIKHGPRFEPMVDGFLGEITDFVPLTLCWVAAASAGPRRREVAAMAAAITSFSIGDLVYLIMVTHGGAGGFPSPADLGYVMFYPLAFLAIALSVRRELRLIGGSVWLDSLLGGLGAAAVLAVVLQRVVSTATGHPFQGGLALLYPICDLLLVAAVIGIAAIQGRRMPWHWFALLAALLCFACADVLSALSLANDSYELGGAVDVIWPTGLALMSLWALAGTRQAGRVERPEAMLVPAIATVASLGVLVAAGRSHVSLLAIVLATFTQIATAGRTQVAFRQLRRLADLRRQATTDELTGLPNRRAFYARAQAELAVLCAPVGSHGTLALLLLDLDRFKEVNDSLGHLVGDELLVQIGERLAERLGDGDLVARLGGDEFAILLLGTTSERAIQTAIDLRACICAPHTLEGIALRTDVSIGLVFAPDHGQELNLLLRRADIAMYKAKQGREGYRIYAEDDDLAGAGKLLAQQELHVALAEDEMVVHYQPKLDLATNQVHDVEALIRWNHPTRGLLYPDSFLAVVEDAGLMRALTSYVLARAASQAARWRGQGRPITIAVNLSASCLVDTELPHQIDVLLQRYDLPASALQLEITEEFLMADRDRSLGVLSELHDRGLQIAVDDFGTGYSSLAYLRDLPIDELKLDRSFVFPMSHDPRAAALVFSTIDLAHSLGLRMVAEGVESQAALTELARHGCDQAQGYHIARALPAAELDLWLDRHEQRHRVPMPSLPEA